MYIIGNVLVSDEIIEESFLCNLQACKGACCWEGDYGAPLEKEELEVLDNIYPEIRPFLSPAGRAVLEQEGKYLYEAQQEEYVTPLIAGGPCAYITYNETGIAQCGIEKAFLAGATNFRKPVSCHLYPIRAKREAAGFETINYERWEICKAACTAGKKASLPLYRFVKDALIRKYGEAWYDALEAAASGGE
ncbi:MAG: DUF3109 family protein [Saprospiraceae bacterium]|jgi:hypothetical protein